MKKVLFSFATILFLASSAQARSVMADVRLQFQSLPNGHIAGGKTTTLSVYSDGQVVESYAQALPMPLPSRLVTRLDAYQMDRIERLIDRARGGAKVTIPNRVYCFVAPMYTERYTADNGRVFLKSGVTCEPISYNVRPAAQELVRILNNLRRLATPIADAS